MVADPPRSGILFSPPSASSKGQHDDGGDARTPYIAAPRRVTFASDIEQVQVIPSVKSFRRKYGRIIVLCALLGLLAMISMAAVWLFRVLGAKLAMALVCMVAALFLQA